MPYAPQSQFNQTACWLQDAILYMKSVHTTVRYYKLLYIKTRLNQKPTSISLQDLAVRAEKLPQRTSSYLNLTLYSLFSHSLTAAKNIFFSIRS